MKRNAIAGRRRWCAVALLAASVWAHAADDAASAGMAGKGNDSVATVNGQPIGRAVFDELLKERSGVANPYDESTPEEAQERRQAFLNVDRNKALEDLVVMEVLAQKARARGMHLRPDIAAEAQLQYKTLLGQHLVREMINEIKVEPDEIAARHAAQPPEQQYQLSHILLKDETAARAAIAAIDKGARFEKIAHERTIDKRSRKGGSLGWLMLNQMEEPVAAAAMALKAGEYTRQPVETPYGWHVIRMHATRDLKKPPLDDVRGILRAQILQEKVQARVRQLMREAKIEVHK